MRAARPLEMLIAFAIPKSEPTESESGAATTQQRVRQEPIPQFTDALPFPPVIAHHRLARVPAMQIQHFRKQKNFASKKMKAKRKIQSSFAQQSLFANQKSQITDF